jgi:hypothetical protein
LIDPENRCVSRIHTSGKLHAARERLSLRELAIQAGFPRIIDVSFILRAVTATGYFARIPQHHFAIVLRSFVRANDEGA